MINLKEKRDILRKKTYHLMFEIFGIFGIPAFGAYLLGKYLINQFLLPSYVWVFVLFISFSLSWVIFFFRFRQISKELKDLNQKIRNKE